jgi:uncharacterized protein
MKELAPEINDLNRPYWDGLANDELRFQRCLDCGNAWLPPRENCSRCLGSNLSWERSHGTGRIVSWVVYHREFHPEFAARTPYNVAIVGLEEGPRLITNIIAETDDIAIDKPVRLRVEEESGIKLARFELLG